ncbi:hypothetical protein BLOT_010374 [Blomia tropicalis]|nr:hypothetical protein BLOT_010374 [Blomia tropicalis]
MKTRPPDKEAEKNILLNPSLYKIRLRWSHPNQLFHFFFLKWQQQQQEQHFQQSTSIVTVKN